MYWRSYINPNITYLIVWTLTVYLIDLKLTINLKDFSGAPAYMIYGTLFVSVLYYFIFNLSFKENKTKISHIFINTEFNKNYISKISDFSFKIFLFLTVIDTAYSGGFPLIKLFVIGVSEYSDIGIPSLKGIVHTLYYTSTILLFCEYIFGIKSSKLLRFRVIYAFAYPFLMMSRALLMGILLEMLFCYLYTKKIKFKIFINIFLMILLIIFIFGLIGDFRGAYANPFSYLVDPGNDVLNNLPSGFTWIYIYITANFNNILATYGSFIPDGSFREIFYNVVPGALKNLIFPHKNTDFSPILLDENLNVASMYVGYVSGFGAWGGFFGGAIFLLIGNLLFFSLRKNPNIGILIANSVFFASVIIGIFFDNFLTISTITQFVLYLFISRKLNSRFNRRRRNI